MVAESRSVLPPSAPHPPDWSVSIGRMSEEGILLFSTSTKRVASVSEPVPEEGPRTGKPRAVSGGREGLPRKQLAKRVWKQLAVSADAIRAGAAISTTRPADVVVGWGTPSTKQKRRRPCLRRGERMRRTALKANQKRRDPSSASVGHGRSQR